MTKNVLIVISLLKKHNIRQIVLSPGGTNLSFVRYVQKDDFFTCHSVVDERSAMYFAIGLYLATGQTIAACCTSAQATRNYLPGLTEAFYKHVPILAITFSKHPRFTYQDYMQAPDQTSLPNDSVKKSFALPYVSNYQDELFCERLTNDAILETVNFVCGPVQLNVPMLDNELAFDRSVTLPQVKVINRYDLENQWDITMCNRRILLVIGEHMRFSTEEMKLIENFAELYNCCIYVNHLSNCKNSYTVFGNLLLTSLSQKEFDECLCPDILITIGGQTGDYPLYHKLADSKKLFEHWRISEDGAIVDTYDKLTKVFQCSIVHFFNKVLKDCGAYSHNYVSLWIDMCKKLKHNIDLPLSNVFLAQQLHYCIPENSYVNFAILNSLRSWSYFEMDKSITCYSNVGAFGIDGGLSTLIGQSVVVDNLCFMVIGDLSFFYDMNSLGIREIKENVRILLINNNGGVEFKLAGEKINNVELDEYVAAAGHFKNAKGWAETNNFKYMHAMSKDDFFACKESFLSQSDRSILFEIFVSDQDDALAIQKLVSANKKKELMVVVRNNLVKMIGESNMQKLKTIIKK